MLDRGGYWQCGYVIAKGTFAALRAEGLDAFRGRIASLAPSVRAYVGALKDWSAVSLLTVRVDRLRRWCRPGLLCIGDAAHAMSPIGGVGINLAIQDAVAAANLLAAPLRERRLTVHDLERVQRRRALPTRLTQRVQVFLQERVIRPVLAGAGPVRPPWILRLVARVPLLQRVPARLVGLGIRPEHVCARAQQ
jgi:2-polyprenyl-6-methoxyphenol hydroxylase-like FAD-dependent oxidoreductase